MTHVFQLLSLIQGMIRYSFNTTCSTLPLSRVVYYCETVLTPRDNVAQRCKMHVGRSSDLSIRCVFVRVEFISFIC